MSRRRDSRGIALIEAALVVPLLVLLAFGAIEAGFAYRDGNTLARATQAAARVDARVADGRLADYEALRTLDSALAAIDASSITKVIIFDATATGGDVPASCKTLTPSDAGPIGQPGSCNVYSATQVRTDDPSKFSGGCGGMKWDANWCPTNRIRTGDDPDRVGMFVELSYDKAVKVLPGSIALTQTAVFQLEPCVAGDSTC
ncbi:MAG: TadE/TadG family type IV pilus assembly protein [Acidimicrobiales bacterium]|nr:TadE/TadG family type IV pilus assembly protein [Acidimicrobiales bacterium]